MCHLGMLLHFYLILWQAMPVFDNENNNFSICKGHIPKFPVPAKIKYCKHRHE